MSEFKVEVVKDPKVRFGSRKSGLKWRTVMEKVQAAAADEVVRVEVTGKKPQNISSAVHRAAKAFGIKVVTHNDENSVYIKMKPAAVPAPAETVAEPVAQ